CLCVRALAFALNRWPPADSPSGIHSGPRDSPRPSVRKHGAVRALRGVFVWFVWFVWFVCLGLLGFARSAWTFLRLPAARGLRSLWRCCSKPSPAASLLRRGHHHHERQGVPTHLEVVLLSCRVSFLSATGSQHSALAWLLSGSLVAL